MKPILVSLALTLLACGTSLAQTPQPPAPLAQVPVESVTAEGLMQKDPAIERHFSQSMLTPSVTDDHQYALWKKVKICPRVTGLSPADAVFVQHRIREVAAQAEAPLDARDPCTPNALIFFTVHPQQLLDALGDADPMRIYGNNTNRALITQPIQSWYTILARNWNGQVGVDAACGYRGIPDGPPCGSPSASFSSRLKLGLSPELGAALVVVDIRTVVGMTLGTLADYLALRVLVPVPPGEDCKPAPSIANLMVKDCDAAMKTASLTPMDSALIDSLYHSVGDADQVQRQRVVQGMKERLEAAGH